MDKIFNTAVYGLTQSIIRSGYPMRTSIPDDVMLSAIEPHTKRAIKLSNATQGSGHGNFLKGIIVQCDVTAASYVWPQIQRYRFFEIISSTSKMHTIKLEPGETYEECLGRMTMDYELTAGITTNYMCLRNMYHQRKNHRLKFWTHCFVPWVESLPMAKELIIGI